MNTKTVVPLFSASLVNGRFDLAPVLQRVLDSNSYILGKEVTQFEQEFARYTGVEHCVSVANGSEALEIA
ncbi:MAG: erythromycin biosynthesis sensory transduction protein eryC1, partial [Alphaproteobacteria bacterium]